MSVDKMCPFGANFTSRTFGILETYFSQEQLDAKIAQNMSPKNDPKTENLETVQYSLIQKKTLVFRIS